MRRHSLQLRLVRDPKTKDVPAEATVPQNDIETTIIEVVKETGAVVAGSFLAYKIVDTASKVVLHIAKTKIQ